MIKINQMFNEIGSEFWLSGNIRKNDTELPEWLKLSDHTVLTSLGRGAISLLLQNIEPFVKFRKALLPSYICDSVVNPFIEKAFDCSFYPINRNLEPDLDSLRKIDLKKIDIFLHLGYFGFPTNENLETFLNNLRNQSLLIVEDISHTLFSNICKLKYNDFYFGSIRKWAGMPSGAFLTSKQAFPGNSSLLKNTTYVPLREEALWKKAEYTREIQPSIKEEYLKLFRQAQELMNNDNKSYMIDTVSLKIINTLDIELLITRRRHNYLTLFNLIKDVNVIEPVFSNLPVNVTPLFFPVLCHTDREKLKSYLIKKNIFCSIHWPAPKNIVLPDFPESEKIYKTVLSIPIDQRYKEKDMLRISEALKNF